MSKRMFRFTIRDVLWLTTLAAVFAAWGIDHAKTRIDWQGVKRTELQLRATKSDLLLAQAQAERTRQEPAGLMRVAHQLGISVLELEPETKLNADLVESD